LRIPVKQKGAQTAFDGHFFFQVEIRGKCRLKSLQMVCGENVISGAQKFLHLRIFFRYKFDQQEFSQSREGSGKALQRYIVANCQMVDQRQRQYHIGGGTLIKGFPFGIVPANCRRGIGQIDDQREHMRVVFLLCLLIVYLDGFGIKIG